MSSFNTYDNYNSFNDLINRSELLEEKTYKAMVKGANLGPELKKFRSEDGKGLSATSRVKNLILISALVQMDLLDDDVAATLKRKATSSSYITNTLKDLAPKVHAQLFDGDNPGSEEVVKYVQDNIDQLLPFAVKNVTRGEYEKAEVDTEVPDDAEAKELEDEVSAEVRLAKGLMDGEAEKVELDFDEADIFIDGIDAGVKNAVSQQAADYLNKQGIKAGLKAEVTRAGVNIEAPTGFFGDAARMAQFEDKLKGLVMDMDSNIPEERIRVKFTGSDGPVEYKDEDYEEGPEPMEPEGPANEYEEDINEVEDNEFDDFDIGPQSDENVPDDYEEVLAALVDDDKKKHAIKKLNGEDPVDVAHAKGHIAKDDVRMIKKLRSDEDEEVIQVESTTAAYLTEQKDRDNRFKVDVVEEGIGNLAAAAGRGLVKAAKSKTAKKVARGIGNFAKDAAIETGRVAAELGGEGLRVAGKAVMKGADKVIDAADKGISRLASDEEIKVGSMVTTNYGEVVHIDEIDTDSDMKGRPVYMGTDKDGGDHILYPDQIHAVSPEDEESIVMQPMLESPKTNTSAYLIEQSASDKRNKKTAVKNQSFKEKYKPKTQWQLEELRRYGL